MLLERELRVIIAMRDREYKANMLLREAKAQIDEHKDQKENLLMKLSVCRVMCVVNILCYFKCIEH